MINKEIFKLVPHKNPFIITTHELINHLKHQKKVINRLSRKIQKLKTENQALKTSRKILQEILEESNNRGV